LGATPPCCFGRLAPFAPTQQPRGLAARTTAGCTHLCPAESPPSARHPAFCAHHDMGNPPASARAGFSLAQAAAFCNHLLQSPVATKPKALWLMEALRGFCQPFAAESGRSPKR